MNIEIMEFYPLQRNDERGTLTGTLRVKLCDSGIHILGVFVSRRKESWHFALPGRKGIHHETGEPVRYPFLVFEDQDQHRELMAAIREQGRLFVEDYLKEHPQVPEAQNRIEQPQAPDEPKKCKEAKENDEKPLSKQAPLKVNPVASKIAGKNWVDVPKRKTATLPRKSTKF